MASLSSLLQLIDLTGHKTQTGINILARLEINRYLLQFQNTKSRLRGEITRGRAFTPSRSLYECSGLQQLPLTQGNRSALTTADLHFNRSQGLLVHFVSLPNTPTTFYVSGVTRARAKSCITCFCCPTSHTLDARLEGGGLRTRKWTLRCTSFRVTKLSKELPLGTIQTAAS
jgi:hypothetical protein